MSQRVRSSVSYYHSPRYSSLLNLNNNSDKKYGILRIATFLIGIVILPVSLITIPLYLRHRVYTDSEFAVTESDVLKVDDRISSIFCQGQTLKMNTSFNAFQVSKNSSSNAKKYRKHINIAKSMNLPDDSIEYWGFFLNEGSTVNLSICARFDGGKIMVVEDDKDFHACGLLHPSKLEEIRIINNKDFQVLSKNSTPKIQIKEEEDLDIEESNDEFNKNDEFLQLNNKKFLNNKKNYHDNNFETKNRIIRSTIQHKQGMLHGKTENDTINDSDVSSFENTLIECHNGHILLSSNFNSSNHCTDIKYLENGTHLQIEQNVHKDGYYYYIFYSDNDYVNNNVYAIFNIYKPTYEYGDFKNSCINVKECKFSIPFLSDEQVIVEIPTTDGIEHNPDDVTILISVCEPRLLIYAIFPIALILCIFLFSFL